MTEFARTAKSSTYIRVDSLAFGSSAVRAAGEPGRCGRFAVPTVWRRSERRPCLRRDRLDAHRARRSSCRPRTSSSHERGDRLEPRVPGAAQREQHQRVHARLRRAMRTVRCRPGTVTDRVTVRISGAPLRKNSRCTASGTRKTVPGPIDPRVRGFCHIVPGERSNGKLHYQRCQHHPSRQRRQ